MITVLKVQNSYWKTHLNDWFSNSIVRKASRCNAHLAFTGIDYAHTLCNTATILLMMTTERALLYLLSITGEVAHYIKTPSQEKGAEKYMQFCNSLA